MILVSTLYDEYIDRRKLTEQKNPFEYIVAPLSRGVGTITIKLHYFFVLFIEAVSLSMAFI